MPLKDLTGQRFGRLTVLDRAKDKVDKHGNHSVIWRCRCDCGNITYVRASNLRPGGTRSCGCLQRERAQTNCGRKLIDLTGQRFGYLTVIKRVENHGHRTYWLCRCDCGKLTEVDGANLRGGIIRSCGCQRAKNFQETFRKKREAAEKLTPESFTPIPTQKVSRKYLKKYTVYNNETDFPVIIDGTFRECAAAMGISPSSFHKTLNRCKNGECQKWYIEDTTGEDSEE